MSANQFPLRSNASAGAFRRSLILLSCGLLLASAGCSHKSAAGDEGEGKSDAGAAVAEVTLTKVARADVTQMLAVTGAIAALPNQDVRVSSLVPGRIADMKVAEGDRVTAAQVVAQIEDRPYRDQLRQAEAGVATAQANLENARLSRARNENLFERGIAARKDLEDARTQESVTEAALRQAQAALELSRLQLARTQIHALLTGTVVKRFVGVGEQVDGTAAQPILEVANLEQVELMGNVPAVYLVRIHAGQSLAIMSDAFPGKSLTGRVVAVSSAVDPASNSGLVRIRMANAGGSLRLGMFLSAQVPIETHAHALVVPPEAIYRDQEGQAHVYLVQGENATSVDVKLGIQTHDRVELLTGVKEGDTLILTGGYGLGEKAKVKPLGQNKP